HSHNPPLHPFPTRRSSDLEYLDYERLRGRTPLGEQTPTRLHELLLARSKLEAANVDAPAAPAVRPDEGHRSARAGVAFGRQNGRSEEHTSELQSQSNLVCR